MNNIEKLIVILEKEDLNNTYDYLKNGNNNYDNIDYKDLRMELKILFLKFTYSSFFLSDFKVENRYYPCKNIITTKIINFLKGKYGKANLDNFDDLFDNIINNLKYDKYDLIPLLKETNNLYENTRNRSIEEFVNNNYKENFNILFMINDLMNDVKYINKEHVMALLKINNPELIEEVNNNYSLVTNKKWLEDNLDKSVALCITSLVTQTKVNNNDDETDNIQELISPLNDNDNNEPLLPNDEEDLDKTQIIPIITEDILNDEEDLDKTQIIPIIKDDEDDPITFIDISKEKMNNDEIELKKLNENDNIKMHPIDDNILAENYKKLFDSFKKNKSDLNSTVKNLLDDDSSNDDYTDIMKQIHSNQGE